MVAVLMVFATIACTREARRPVSTPRPMRVIPHRDTLASSRITRPATLGTDKRRDKSVATVNGIPILRSDWRKELARHGDLSKLKQRRVIVRRQLFAVTLAKLIDRELLRQEVDRLKLDVNVGHVADRFDALRHRFPGDRGLNRWIKSRRITKEELLAQFRDELSVEAILTHEGKLVITDAAIAAFYKAHRFLYYYPNRVRVSMISMYYPFYGDKEKNQKATQAKLNKIREQALKGEDFAALARMYSGHRQTGEKGGDIGYMDKGLNLVSMFDELIDKFQPGDVSKIQDMGEYCAIYKVTEREDAGVKPFGKVIDDLRVNLARKLAMPHRSELLKRLRNKAKIVISKEVTEVKE